jgi:carbon monoxide dehydrogenase subunit G
MELTNEFRVAVPLDTAWTVLNDVELIAPCLPGAQLQEIEGDEYRGIVKVKVGPITAQYKGAATFLSQDRDAGTVVLHAEGRDTRGQGTASADITVQLTEDGTDTAVQVSTDLKITGKVAQFGRGVLADVSAKLLDEFVECLETKVLADGGPAGSEAAGSVAAPAAVRTVSGPEPEPVDLLDSAGAPMFKRLAPIITAVILILFLGRRRRRRRGPGGS